MLGVRHRRAEPSPTKIKNGAVNGPLLIAQRHHRIDFGGAAGWDVAGRERHGEQIQRNGDEGERVGGLDAREQACEESRERRRSVPCDV